ncbi:tRNA (adenine-N(1)-)-methyltransferase catalytic subunit trm61 [Ascosphaera acerosa]|nr:tRNA (adenine-N(1)-)-methyltransferase catalytic subunit trm61 [Ascosphaera acerosa]
MPSPFLTPGTTAEAGSLAILHLRRDQLLPTILSARDEDNEGYAEGKVTNTRYGSFPHTTMIGKPWGSQILASNVDTGSRGRRKKQKTGAEQQTQTVPAKRKAALQNEAEGPVKQDAGVAAAGGDDDDGGDRPPEPKTPATASSGFIHLLAPTPEAWTASLPHRTQVVYTPDYSYILHRIRARPGSTIIEAGAGSGSFTHASVRAVFNGYPETGTVPGWGSDAGTADRPAQPRRTGKVCSFEYHAQRVEHIREELRAHGMQGLVEVTHRDVYSDGFLLGEPRTGRSPRASAVFLDLPAPWNALKHLTRHPEDGSESPLDPASTVHICTFSPCMEQVQSTVSALRQYGWLNISMVEIQHRNIEVRRERYSVEGDGGRGTVPGPRNVEEAVANLQRMEERARYFHAAQAQAQSQAQSSAAASNDGGDNDDDMTGSSAGSCATSTPALPPPSRAPGASEAAVPVYKQGKVTHRWENELKTHTSYLVFAILPVEWTDEDEQKARETWPSSVANETLAMGKSKKQMKREAKAARYAEKLRLQQEEERRKREQQDAGSQ